MSAVVVATLWACLNVYSICMPVADYSDGHHCIVASGEGLLFMNDGSEALALWKERYPEFKNVPAKHVTFECRRDT